MRRQHGFSRLELGIVTALFAVLVGTFLNTVRYQQEQAEKLGVELTVMSMRTGLLSEAADRLIKGRGQDSADMLGSNPVRWLKSPPAGYLGEFKEVDEQRLAPGSWYFDQSAGEMVYKLNLHGNFRRLDRADRNEIRWRVQWRQGSDGKVSTVGELVLAPTVAFEWF